MSCDITRVPSRPASPRTAFILCFPSHLPCAFTRICFPSDNVPAHTHLCAGAILRVHAGHLRPLGA